LSLQLGQTWIKPTSEVDRFAYRAPAMPPPPGNRVKKINVKYKKCKGEIQSDVIKSPNSRISEKASEI
jgi:hypothetical protein